MRAPFVFYAEGPPPLAPDYQVHPASAPGLLWAKYADAIGLDVMKSTYGENWPPVRTRRGEKLFAVRDRAKPLGPAFSPSEHPAGWISLTQDQFDEQHYYMSRGVWPDEHGKQLGRFMRSWAASWVSLQNGVALSIWVHVSNEQHYESVRRDPFWEVTRLSFDPNEVMFTHFI